MICRLQAFGTLTFNSGLYLSTPTDRLPTEEDLRAEFFGVNTK